MSIELATSVDQMNPTRGLLDLERRSLLIVSDELRALRKVIETAKRMRFQVFAVTDAEAALRVFEFHLPSAILLDLDFLGMSGEALWEHLRQNPYLSKVPVHVISRWKDSPQSLAEIESLLQGKSPGRPPAKCQIPRLKFEGRTVLLVVDDWKSLLDFDHFLLQLGMSVLISRSPLDALVQLEQHPETDLVVLSQKGISNQSHELVKRLRNQSHFENLPVISVGAGRQDSEIAETESALGFFQVPPPFRESDFISTLERALQEKS